MKQDKYLLISEQEKITDLIQLLAQKLEVKDEQLQHIEQLFYHFIKNNKEASLEEMLENYMHLLQIAMEPLLRDKITPGMQVGIRNQSFSVIGYGGNWNGRSQTKEILENTFFSFDSISKIFVSIVMMQLVREEKIKLSTLVKEYNPEFALDASIESILKFTAMIRTEKRIDGLGYEEMIAILKRCQENLAEKCLYKNFYEYNDIGYMILRLSMDGFLEEIDAILEKIPSNQLTYDWKKYMVDITGGKLGEEWITPDLKGRDILFPGHTGLYGSIEGLLTLFDMIFNTEAILSEQERALLFKQPYIDPVVYAKDGHQLVGKNQSLQYMAKIGGIYRMPDGIKDNNYNKMASCDMSAFTTKEAKASTGTCGSWVVTDNLTHQGHFGTYTGGLLTNPYSFVEVGNYPEVRNAIPDTNLMVNQKGVILGYQSKLNLYKERITTYGLLLELITEYIKETDKQVLQQKHYRLTKKIS